jgi:hypothetical protein
MMDVRAEWILKEFCEVAVIVPLSRRRRGAPWLLPQTAVAVAAGGAQPPLACA